MCGALHLTAIFGRWKHHGNRAGGGPPTTVRHLCGSTRKGQAVVVMPINWQQPRTGALAAIFGWWNAPALILAILIDNPCHQAA
jgi:hypothetical protein